MSRCRRATVLAFLFAAFAAPGFAQTPSPPPEELTANDIYDRTRATANARTLPPYISYTTHATFERKGKMKAEHYHTVVRTSDGKSYVTPLPDSPRDRIDTTPRIDDRPPYLSLFTTFGLIRRSPGEKPSMYEANAAPAPEASDPPVIGSVKVTARAYDVTLLGSEDLAGHAVYHIALRPLYDPEHHLLRELYVAKDSYRVERAVIQAYGAAGPIRTRPLVTIDYTPVGGAQAIVRISVDVTLRALFFAYGGHGELRVEDLEAPESVPDWMFDKQLLAEHEKGAASTPRP
jgi:hypothetical protein